MSNGSASMSRYHSRQSCPPPSIPPPPSAANSLRSVPTMSLRSTGNSTLFRHSIALDSIPISDTIVPNDDRSVIANDILKEKTQMIGNEIVETKVSANILPIFIMESLSLLGLCALAYVLRFTDSFDVLVRGFYCDDKSISMPYKPKFGNNSRPMMTGYSKELFYSLTIGLPLALVSRPSFLFLFISAGSINLHWLVAGISFSLAFLN